PEQFERSVDPTGTIDLPQLGRLFVSGQSIEGVRETISDAMKKFVAEPLVGVVIRELRQQTFTMVGAVARPGPYFIPSIDYKLVEASTSGGRIDESTKELLVIRSVPLDERAMSPRDTRRSPLPSSGPVRSTTPNPSVPNEPPKSGESLIDLIDQLSKPEGAPATPSEKPLEAPKPQGEPPVQLPDSP
ncbi:MAG: polysaccharide biosynthesis/export family protein, partial [Phycisphaerae bacterium]